ncbi:hypothetical protein HPB51_006183 [Rhipicephalus microplus]|uniref:C2H2-type domain-containing protein n=1 Tax=Rhipicephalus microplus TaxID=6941 RepID=A0A9J6E783_RHIMP|nr:hypothetical protein HPB51_006183 [Rhipicephalus microplus]
MVSGGSPAPDDREDDGDPPIQERQSERAGTTLMLFLSLPVTFHCCEEGCVTAYNLEVWRSRRQSLQPHLEGEPGVWIPRWCTSALSAALRWENGCLVNLQAAAPPPPLAHRYQCPTCSSSFTSKKELYNHE